MKGRLGLPPPGVGVSFVSVLLRGELNHCGSENCNDRKAQTLKSFTEMIPLPLLSSLLPKLYMYNVQSI